MGFFDKLARPPFKRAAAFALSKKPGSGGDGGCTLTIDESSSWVVTGDSVVTTLNCSGSIVDAEGRTVTIVDSNGNVLSEGESEYTITVNTLQITTA